MRFESDMIRSCPYGASNYGRDRRPKRYLRASENAHGQGGRGLSQGHGGYADRPGLGTHARWRDGGGVRRADTVEPGGSSPHTGGAVDYGAPLRSIAIGRDREGDPLRRSGTESDERRQDDP